MDSWLRNGPTNAGLFFSVERNTAERVYRFLDAPVAQGKRSRFVIDRLGVRIPSGALENQSRRHGFQRSKVPQKWVPKLGSGFDESGDPRLRREHSMCEDFSSLEGWVSG